MSNHHIFVCDRCGKTEQDKELPNYWARIHVYDSNQYPLHGGRDYDKDFCNNCMEILTLAMKRPTTKLTYDSKYAVGVCAK